VQEVGGESRARARARALAPGEEEEEEEVATQPLLVAARIAAARAAGQKAIRNDLLACRQRRRQLVLGT
jgi:hypothetical protein